MSSERLIVADFADLKHVSVICQKCQTEIVLDASNSKSEFPEKCPSCRTNYEFGLSAAYDSFKTSYVAMARSGVRVRIQES
jgi:DNA replicative helicase MCM subunit Mcm2 (Cdc46/Mcm family)